MAKPMAKINPSGQQLEAIDKIAAWYKIPFRQQKYFFLAGYAGTGKTSIVPHIIEALGLSYSDVCFATYTGKAAKVLSDKIGSKVSTIHSACYQLDDDYLDETTNKVEMVFKFNSNSKVRDSKLVIIDEFSMVTKEIMMDILRFNVKILLLGDPFQLPPVGGDAFFTEDMEPDYFLTEIHRQALENPIIWASKEIREGRLLAPGTYGDKVFIMPQDECPDDYYLQADQVLCGTNKTRKATNKWFRDALGFSKIDPVFPVEGDRLICLRNYHKIGLVNGMGMVATSNSRVERSRESFKISFDEETPNGNPERFTDMLCSAADIRGIQLRMPYWEQKKLINVDYGNTITVHKSQGSQYDDVLFIDENFCRWNDYEIYLRHYYTAMTRAAEHFIGLQ